MSSKKFPRKSLVPVNVVLSSAGMKAINSILDQLIGIAGRPR